MTVVRPILAAALVLSGGTAADAGAPQVSPRTGDREIAVLRGDLHVARDGGQQTVFLVTADGIVLVDPMSVVTAQWLADEFATRFPGLPVRYVVLTHHHAERASGSAVFRQTAEIVAHAQFRNALTQTQKRQPHEYRFVSSPTITFTDRRTIEIGGQTVEVIHVGPFHAPDLSVVVFPGERTVFAADPPPLHTVPFAFSSSRPAEVIAWLGAVSSLEFDTIVLSDGNELGREAIAPLAEYLGRLRVEVLRGYQQGLSLEKLQDLLLLEAYRTLPHYAARRDHIAALYRGIRFVRADVTIAAIANYSPRNPPDYCTMYEFCTAGGAAPASSVAATVAIGQRFGVQSELTLSGQFWSARARPLYDEEVVLRPSRIAIFFRYSPLRAGRWSYALLAGPASTHGDVRGMDRVAGRLVPVGGRHSIAARDVRTSFAAGADLSLRLGRLNLVVPVRVTRIGGDLPAYWPSRFDLHAGAGFSLPFFRRLE